MLIILFLGRDEWTVIVRGERSIMSFHLSLTSGKVLTYDYAIYKLAKKKTTIINHKYLLNQLWILVDFLRESFGVFVKFLLNTL